MTELPHVSPLQVHPLWDHRIRYGGYPGLGQSNPSRASPMLPSNVGETLHGVCTDLRSSLKNVQHTYPRPVKCDVSGHDAKGVLFEAGETATDVLERLAEDGSPTRNVEILIVSVVPVYRVDRTSSCGRSRNEVRPTLYGNALLGGEIRPDGRSRHASPAVYRARRSHRRLHAVAAKRYHLLGLGV